MHTLTHSHTLKTHPRSRWPQSSSYLNLCESVLYESTLTSPVNLLAHDWGTEHRLWLFVSYTFLSLTRSEEGEAAHDITSDRKTASLLSFLQEVPAVRSWAVWESNGGFTSFLFLFFKLFLSGQHLKAKMHAAGGAEAEPQKKRSRIFKMEGELDGKFAVLF